MFTHLRQSAQGFFAKLILLFLIAMFVLWGVGDIFRTMGSGPSTVATVGRKTITIQELRGALQRRPGQKQQVLSGLINDALVEQEEAALGIVVNDDVVVDFIAGLPEFKGKDGRFDKVLYEKMLMNAGTNEGAFVQDIRQEIGAKLLLNTFTGWVQVPENLVAALYKTREEQRVANLFYLPASAVATRTAKPTAEEVKAYYDKHAKDFTAPEYRTLTYVVLPLSDVQAKIDVSADDIKKVWDERKDDYRQPDRKEVDDLQFDNEQDAKAAAAAIAKDGFVKAAPGLNVSNKGKTSKGLIAATDLPEDSAEKVFALPQEGVTSPMLISFAWHIYHVGKTVPGGPDTFEQAKSQITSELSAHQAQETAGKLINGFEDALAGGATLEAAAEKIGQKPHTLGPVAHNGTMQDGAKAEIPPYANFLNVAFNLPEGDHSQAVQAQDGSFFLVRADKVMPSHIKPLNEVRDEATRAVETEKTQIELQKTAEKFSESLRAGKKPAEADAAANVALQPASSGVIKRANEAVPEGALKGKPLPRGLINEIFRSAVGESTHAYPTGEGAYLVATLMQVTPAPATADAKVTDGIREELKATLADELLHQFLGHLRNKYPLSINAAALGGNNQAPAQNEDTGE